MSICALTLMKEQLYHHLTNCCKAERFELNSAKQYLLSSVNEMTSSRRSFSLLNSAARTVKFSAEKMLLKDLNNDCKDKNSVILALCRYHLTLRESCTHERGNTAQFLQQTARAFGIKYIPAQLNQGRNLAAVSVDGPNKMFGIAHNILLTDKNRYEGALTNFSADNETGHTNYLEDGEGECYRASSLIFRGHYSQGQRHGTGTLWMSDGRKIRGQFSQHAITGDFEVTFKHGDIYKGQLLEGNFTGQGTYTQNNGTVVKGNFVNGNLDVSKGATVKLADGRVFTGNVDPKTLSGTGTLTTANGKTIEGTFDAGNLTGQGKLQWPSLDTVTYEGEIVNEMLCGNGTLTIKKTDYKGAWQEKLFYVDDKDKPDDFICCITMELMNDPVNPTPAITSSSFVDRNSLYKSVLNKPTNPITREPLTLTQVSQMKTNVELQQKISKWRAENIKEIRTLFEQHEIAVPLEYQ